MSARLHQSDGRRRTRVLLLVDRFSPDSGGRTRVAFLRAAALARTHESATLLTFNHRLSYDEVVRSWRERLALPQNVHVANFYEHLAGDVLYSSAGPSRRFEPAPGLVPRKGRASWEERVDGALLRRFVLRPDRSLNYVDEWAQGLLVRHDNYDVDGVLRVMTHYEPGTRVAVAREFFTGSGRRFLSWRAVQGARGEAGSQMCVHGGASDTAGAFVDEQRLRERWVADLVGPTGPVAIMCEARRLDALAVDNPQIDPARGVRTIATVHSCHLQAPYEDPTLVWTYSDGMLRNADAFTHVITLTDTQRKDIEGYYGPRPTLVTLPHPVGDASGPPRRWRSRLRAVVRRPPTVVVVARLVPHKRIEDVIHAFASIAGQVPGGRLDIWGSGPLADELRALVDALGVAKGVRLRGHTDDPFGAFTAGQVSVTTSRAEGLGMTTLESLVVGTPVIAYDYRYGPRDLLRTGLTGWIVPNGNVDALAAAMLQALGHPQRTRLMGLAARTVRWTHSERRHTRRLAALVDATARG